MPSEPLRSLVKTLYKTRDGSPLLLTDGQLQIYEAIVTRSTPPPKEEAREEGIESPDVADALMLSFAKEGYSANLQDETDRLMDEYDIFPSVA